MARLDEYLFGYFRGRVETEDVSRLVNALLKLEICSDVAPSGDFSLGRRDKARFFEYAAHGLRFRLSGPLGLWGALVRLCHSYGILLALALGIFIFLVSAGRVWDVRIDGNDRLTDRQIETYLASQGLEIGVPWRSIDKSAVENSILTENGDIAWISVNRRGTVAYVQLIESENTGIPDESAPPYSNLIAECDGVIEEITVESGAAAVKVGDVVRAGDVLISGIVESEKGITLCRAAGVVRASSVTELTATVTETASERAVIGHRTVEIRLNIFNFSVNIFKNYGNCENTCDIIRENRNFALFGKLRLPIRIEKAYAVEYEQRQYKRSEEEMSSLAKRQLDAMMYSVFKDSDVLKLRTESHLSDGVYRITARVVYSTDIGKVSAIEIN